MIISGDPLAEQGKIDYIWDNDQLIGEYQHGEYTWYINLPNQFHPVALIKQGEVYYYHLDQLNTPRFVTNNKAEVVWENQAGVYGYEESEVSNTNSFTQPIRFQGQYLDIESGLHYNRYRYYSPKQQRFINQDPIGLVGGINHYQYAPNPVNWVDPMGLMCEEGEKSLKEALDTRVASGCISPKLSEKLFKAAQDGQLTPKEIKNSLIEDSSHKLIKKVNDAKPEYSIEGPSSLADVLDKLELAKQRIDDNGGYVPKYSDDELRSMASSGQPPTDRFVVRFSTAPKNNETKEVIIPELNEGPVGHLRESSGRHPLWMSTFDQIEYADSDPKIIADVFGTNYDPNQDYVLYVIDRGEDHEQNGSDVFVPTFSNIKEKLKIEFAGELDPHLVDKVMTPEYSKKFRKHWSDFNTHLSDRGLHWTESFKEDRAQAFAVEHFSDSGQADEFLTRQVILSEIGAWEVFTGDGLTEMKSKQGKPGALEILEIQHSPVSVKELIAQKKILEIPLKHS
nr:RHS repeat-associated core domain-containing protein [Pseudoalteromonas prydzensis]